MGIRYNETGWICTRDYVSRCRGADAISESDSRVEGFRLERGGNGSIDLTVEPQGRNIGEPASGVQMCPPLDR